MRLIKLHIIIILMLTASEVSFAQEDELIKVEESAEVFLEEYSDEFQETFFEAIKQKGIQNYDRAANLFLKCKQLKEDEIAIDHELAKTYFLDKKYATAQSYAVKALTTEPSNYWYLDTLIEVLSNQQMNVDALKNTIPYENEKLKQNLALIYLKKNWLNRSKGVLKEIENASFVKELEAKISFAQEMSNKKQVLKNSQPNSTSSKEDVNSQTADPLGQLKEQMEGYIADSNFQKLEEVSRDAFEEYPLQPYFYYAYGLALNKNGNANKAIEVLQTGLEYLFDDQNLSNKIFNQLANAFQSIGNINKANEFRNKIKSGL